MVTYAINKKARFDYEILDTYEAGIELYGFEVKAIRSGKANLIGSYVVARPGAVSLLNADVPPYQPKNMPDNYDQKRSRRLLLKKKEMNELIGISGKKGITLVPVGSKYMKFVSTPRITNCDEYKPLFAAVKY